MQSRRWTLCVILTLALLLGVAGLAQAANRIVVVKSEYTKQDYKKTAAGDFDLYWAAFEKIMNRIGYEGKYDVIADADVEDGKLSVDNYALAILPVNRAMTRKEADEIIKYVKSGGALFANYNVGLKFENSNDSNNYLIADALGVDRAPEFSSGVNPNYAYIRAVDQYHPFFAGIPQSVPFLKHYSVLAMPREGVNIVARYYTDGGVPSNVDRKSGAIFQIGRVVYNGGNIWDPDKSQDTYELNTLIKNVIEQLLSDKIPVVLAPPRKLDDGLYVKGKYTLRTNIQGQKVSNANDTTYPPPLNTAFNSLDADGGFNSILMVAPHYVNGKVEAGVEVWAKILLDRPQFTESQTIYGTNTAAVPGIMTAWTKWNTKELLFTAATRPDGGFDPKGDLKMVGSSDPLGLVSYNVLNLPASGSNWTSNAKMHIKDLKGWTGLVGLGINQGGWPGLSGTQWIPWAHNAYLYLREDTLKLGKTRLELGLTYDQRRLDAWGNDRAWLAQTQVGGVDLKYKTPFGNLVLEQAKSYQTWSSSASSVLGPAVSRPDGTAVLAGIERVPVGGLRFSGEVRTMSDTFRNYSWMGMQDYDFPNEAKYAAVAWANDDKTKRAWSNNVMYFGDQAKGDEAIASWIKYLGNRAVKSQVSGDLIKGVVGLGADYEKISKLSDGSKVLDAGKYEIAGKKAIGIFTPKFTFERKNGLEWRWAGYDEKTSYAGIWGTPLTPTTVAETDYHVRDYNIDNSISKLELGYELSPKVSGTIRQTRTLIDEYRQEVKDSWSSNPDQVWIVRVPGRNVEEDSTNLHADVKVVVSPKTTVTTGVDFYNADRLTSTEDATLAPGRSTSILAKVAHTFSDKMWGNAAAEAYYREGDGAAKNSGYFDLTRQLTKDVNGKVAYWEDAVGRKNITYAQLGYSLPIGSTTGIYLKWRRTTPWDSGYTDNAYVSLTHMVGNFQLTASYGKVPFDTTYTDYGHPWDWMVGGTSVSADVATIDLKMTF
ncbi:MAG: hypothetical protein ACM3UP_00985 [Methanocella sp.]